MELFMFIQYRISMIFLLIFLLLFLKLRYKKLATIVIVCCSFAITSFMGILSAFVIPQYASVITLLQIPIVQGTAFCLDKNRDFRTLFTGITSADYVLAGDILASDIYLWTSSIWLALGVQIAIHTGLMIFLRYQLRDRYRQEMENFPKGWANLCFMPALIYVIMASLYLWPKSIYEAPENTIPALFVMILMFTSYIFIVNLFSRRNAEAELMRTKEYLESYAIHLRKETELLLENERQTAIFRHDIRHSTALIQSYLEEGAYDKIAEFLKDRDLRLEEMQQIRYCENITVNSVLARMAQKAKECQVQYSFRAAIPKELQVNEFEFAIVLSNLLENAIQAAAQVEKIEDRRVDFSSRPVKNQILFEFSNNCREIPDISETTGLPISKRGTGHGYGLRSVQAFAQKYDAIFNFSIKENLFQVSLLTKI